MTASVISDSALIAAYSRVSVHRIRRSRVTAVRPVLMTARGCGIPHPAATR